MERKLFIIILVALSVLSFYLKINTIPLSKSQKIISYQPRISKTLISNSFEYYGRVQLITGEAYTAEVYTSNNNKCIDLVFIIPMLENSEAELLSAKPKTSNCRDYFFILDNKIYRKFPTFELWRNNIISQIFAFIGQPLNLNIVYGISIIGRCEDDRSLPWHVITREL